MIVSQKTQAAGAQTMQPLPAGPADGLPWPSPRAQLLARLRAGALDRELIAGVDPGSSPQLTARALALTSPRSRAALADGLERWLSAAHGATSRRHILPPPDLAAASEIEVRAILAELRGSTPLYARGLARLAVLLSDGTGPAYVGERDALVALFGEARAAIAGHAWPGPMALPGPVRQPSRVPQ
jgi:hypothetical protein